MDIYALDIIASNRGGVVSKKVFYLPVSVSMPVPRTVWVHCLLDLVAAVGLDAALEFHDVGCHGLNVC